MNDIILLIIGLILGFGGVLYGYIGDGGVLSSLIKPTSASIVFGGTFGFVLLSFPLSYIKQLPKALKMAIFSKGRDYNKIIDQIFDLATIARKEGIIAIEAAAEKIPDLFLKNGLLYVADGVTSDFLKEVLENEIEAKTSEYEHAAKVLEGAGGAAPSMGVLGTVMGMVSILREMGSDMDALGAKIATAFIATMYGVSSANLIWLPLGGHIKNRAEEEAGYMSLIVTGLLGILEGEYPAKIRNNLLAKMGELQDGGKPGKETNGKG